MSDTSVLCDNCDYDMTELYFNGELECPRCNKTIIPNFGVESTEDRSVSRGDMPKFSEPTEEVEGENDWFSVDEDMSIDEINEKMNRGNTDIDETDEFGWLEEDFQTSLSTGDRMAIYVNEKEVIGKVIAIDYADNYAKIIDEQNGNEYTSQIEDFYLPTTTDLDKKTNFELIGLQEQLAANNSELGISDTTIVNFTTQLIKMLNKESEGITNSLFFSTTNIRIQEIIKDIFGNVDAQGKARLFTSNISRMWVKNRVYFNGDCLAKINFDMLFQNHASIGLYAKKTNVGIDPIEHLSDRPNSTSSAWIIIIKNGDLIFKFEPSDVRHIKTSDIEIQRWKNQCENTLTCTVCNKTYKAKSEILKESNIPMPGYCLTPSCNSIIFTSEASKIGSGARHYARIATKSHEENKLTLLYNITDKLFYVTTDKFAGEIDVIELWEEFEKTGDMHSSAAKYIPVKHKSNKLEDILELELKLHRSSADLYAKLRGIPLALNSKSTTDLSLTLHELHWLDEQIMRILKKLR